MKFVSIFANVLRNFIIFSGLLLYTNVITAQIENPVGAAAAGMGGTSRLSTDVWSFYNNVAGMSNFPTLQFGVYSENKFAIKDLNRGGAAVVFPFSSYAVGVGFSKMGNSDLNTSLYGVGVSKKLAPGFTCGIKLNYIQTYMGQQNGTYQNVFFDAGIMYTINKDFTGAFHVSNPNRVKLSEVTNNRLPGSATLALGYKISNKVRINTEGVNDLDHGFRFRGGVSYQPNSKYIFRMGLSTGVFNGTFGFGYKYHKINLDVASVYDINLGFSTQLSFRFAFDKELKEKTTTPKEQIEKPKE